MMHYEMYKLISLTLIMAGFSCYFIAAKLWVESDNLNEQRSAIKAKGSILFYFLGFLLCFIGWYVPDVLIFPDEPDSFLWLVGFWMFGSYNVVFAWFSVIVAKKYFHRDPILGIWIGGQHKIVFDGIYGEYNIIDYGGICLESYSFSCEIDYKRRRIKFKWLDIDWEKKDGMPRIVYLGNGCSFDYEITTFKTTSYYLQFEYSIGWMEKQ